MAEWLIEEGIGETRAVQLKDGEIIAARVDWPGELGAGTVVEARLVSRHRGAARGLALLDNGTSVVVDRLPPGASEGAVLRLVVTRPAIAEAGRGKLPRARPTQETMRPAPTLAERLVAEGHAVRPVRRFPASGWSDLIAEAFAGEIAFAGGALLLSPTPAMLLIDIDGEDDPARLALAACAPIARAVSRLDLGGSIGIDFPTIADKAARRALDTALARALADWPHERTAINGFGFVQLVARLERPSLLHRAMFSRAATAARLVLRRAEQLDGAGTTELFIHPALSAHLRADWLDQLRRRTGRALDIRVDPALAIEAPHAQLVER